MIFFTCILVAHSNEEKPSIVVMLSLSFYKNRNSLNSNEKILSPR